MQDPKIEITPEMIRVGRGVWIDYDYGWGDSREFIREIYRAMHFASPSRVPASSQSD